MSTLSTYMLRSTPHHSYPVNTLDDPGIPGNCSKSLEMNGDIFKGIKNRLKLEFYLMNDEWLRDCIEFYVNQHTNVNNNFKLTIHERFEQFYDA